MHGHPCTIVVRHGILDCGYVATWDKKSKWKNMSISKEEIKKISQLARLEINDVEIKKYQEQLSSVLAYIDKLKKVKISDLAILGLESEDYNQTRIDKFLPCSDEERRIVLDQIPEIDNGQVKVGRVI